MSCPPMRFPLARSRGVVFARRARDGCQGLQSLESGVFYPVFARRAHGTIVRPTGENRKENIKFQGLKSLATAVRPTGVDWRFTTSDARIKLKRLYQQIKN